MRALQKITIVLVVFFIALPIYSQKKGLQSVNQADLELHMDFLASDELEGRSTGDPGLNIAAAYLAAQAKHLGLKSADPENGYFQHYIITEKSYDRELCGMTITAEGKEPVVNRDAFYMFPATPGMKETIEGEAVFVGYGINDEANSYNDFLDIDIAGKIVLMMDRAPMNEDGTEAQFDNEKWSGMQNFQFKIRHIMMQQPKAILLVFDPKCGFSSLAEKLPQVVSYIESSKSLKIDGPGPQSSQVMPKMLIIHRSVADQLLAPSGKDLAAIQEQIDRTLTPHSFLIEDVNLKIDLVMNENDLVVPNVFGYIEGYDQVLKNEMVIYSAHFDHLGTDGAGGVFNGADDNASGTVGLIEIAEAFLSEKKAPKRSVGFLWVSAEEIGLFGSKYFSENPLVPIESIASVINLDMISRTKTAEDEASGRSDLTISGGDTVKVIGGIQSKVLMDINVEALEEMELPANYTYNDISHPSQFFYRSDHINFARHDIPVIFYSTGTHVDYHELTDDLSRVDYDRFVKMTQLSFLLGYKTANYKGPIEVNNPMSGWKK